VANSGFKSITRVKRRKKSSPGWFVRVAFRGEIVQKFFSDTNYHSPRAALLDAIEWRNDTEKVLGKPRTDRVVVGMSQRNQTGVIGIRRNKKASQRPGMGKRMSRVYEVTWCPEPGVVRRTSVSIEKYGEKEAFRRALAIREMAEREMYGATLPKLNRRRRLSAR
jgi:hypothetical protein